MYLAMHLAAQRSSRGSQSPLGNDFNKPYHTGRHYRACPRAMPASSRVSSEAAVPLALEAWTEMAPRPRVRAQ